MKKAIAALLLATTIATPALADRSGPGRERHERADRGDRGGRQMERVRQRAEHFQQRAERRQPRMERQRQARAFARTQRRERRQEVRTARAFDRVAQRRDRAVVRNDRRDLARAFRQARAERPRFERARIERPRFDRARVERSRNWGQVRSAIVQRERAERRFERTRFAQARRYAPAYPVRRVVTPHYQSVRYAQPVYATRYYAPDYPAYSSAYAPTGLGGLGGIGAAVLPLLLGSSLGDLGGLGSGLLGSGAAPYGSSGPYAGGYGYADPYGAGAYDVGYDADPFGSDLGGGGDLTQIASLALGSGFLGGGDLLGGLGGLGGGYGDPFAADPQALLAEAALTNLLG